MASLQENIDVYRKQLENGAIQVAYRGLMDYMMQLRTHFSKTVSGYEVSGSLHTGYMDVTYFPISSESIKARKLKIPIVFLHEECRFEVWVSGVNRQTQLQYFELMKEHDWDEYRVVPQGKGVTAILEYILVDNPDFNDLDALTQQIEQGTLRFIRDVENFLDEH